MSRLTNAEIVTATLNPVRGDGYDGVVAVESGDLLILRLHILREDATFFLEVPSPDSDRSQPWVYARPRDVTDWSGMLGIWLNENLTAGVGHLHVDERAEGNYLEITSYGLRFSDPDEHQRLASIFEVS